MRLRKLAGVFAALALAVGVTAISLPAASATAVDGQAAVRLHSLVNDYRAQHALKPLAWNNGIAAVAQDWTLRSAQTANRDGAGTFTHNPSFASQYPAGARHASENIAWNMSVDQAFEWWVNSEPHRANMLRAADTDLGIGVVLLTSGPNKGVYLATVNFGQYERPAPAPAAPEPTQIPPQASEEAETQKPADAPETPAPTPDETTARPSDETTARPAVETPARSAVETPAQTPAETPSQLPAPAPAAEAGADADPVPAPATAPVDDPVPAPEAAPGVAPALPEPLPSAEPAPTASAEAELPAPAPAEPAVTAPVPEPPTEPSPSPKPDPAETPSPSPAPARTELQSSDPALLVPAARGSFAAQATGSQLRLTGLTPGEQYQVFLHSTPIKAGILSVGADGTLPVQIPASLEAGEHRVALYTLEGTLAGWQSFSVQPAVTVLGAPASAATAAPKALAATGAAPGQILTAAAGTFMVLSGGAVLLLLRRRHTAGAE